MAHILLILTTLWATVSGHRLAGSAGVRCCQRILDKEFPERSYRILKSYRQMPQVGVCPKYLEFNTTKGLTFCVLPSEAEKLKEFVDSRSAGIAGVPGRPRLASPNIARATPVQQEVAPTIPVEQEVASTIPVEQEVASTIPVEQEVASTIPVEQEVASTIPVEQEVASTIPVEQEVASTIPEEQEMAPTIPVEQEMAPTIPVEQEVVPTPVQTTAPFPKLKEEDQGSGPSAQPSPWWTARGSQSAGRRPFTARAPGPDAETPAGPGTRGAAADRETASEEGTQPVTAKGEAASEVPGGSDGVDHHPSSPHKHRGAAKTHRGRNYIFLVLLLLAATCFLMLVALAARRADRPTPTTQAARIDLVRYSRVTGGV